MRLTVITALFACIALAAANNSKVSAQTPDLLSTKHSKIAALKLDVLASLEPKTIDLKNTKIDSKLEPKIHEVGIGESLSTIATQYDTTWSRLFNKNENIVNPDVISVGQKLTLPLPDEQLKERPLPEPPTALAVPTAAVATHKNPGDSINNTPAIVATNNRGTSGGNSYSPGYCTWYAKNMRADLPNNLGNADTWVGRAAAQGIATGSTPRIGAIGQQGMHVVYVESVNGDGTVFVSEMNYRGINVISTRTVAASSFRYIY